VKNIITIQHTQAVHHTNGMVGSWTDWELSELGKAQAENIGRKLSVELKGKDWKIYSSDLIRAKQTAAPLARSMGIEIEYRPALREINYGKAVGQTKEWMKENALPVKTYDDPEFPGAETWGAFWKRVSDYCGEIVANEANNIILVSHGGTLAVWSHVWCDSGIQKIEKYGPAGAVSFMRIDEDGKHVVDLLNDISYMSD